MLHNLYMRRYGSYLRKTRYFIQWVIFFIVLYAGYKFYLFVDALEKGIIPSVERPPSIEGFMPIGAFMALKLWLTTGVFDPVHPAALVIFIGSLGLAFLRKSFCGWICPVGTTSEAISRLGKWSIGKNYRLPSFIDYPLRSIKYLLMGFFVYVIVYKMNSHQIMAFLQTPYWKVADIKLLKFFTDMSTLTAIVLLSLFVLTFLYKNFWCRYLCPYGALLGLIGSAGLLRIKRYREHCTNCGLCSKHCPYWLPVDKLDSVRSPECTGCLTCISHCPREEALGVSFGPKKINPFVFVFSIVGLFFGVIFIAKILGKWHSSVSVHELKELIPLLELLRHP